MAQATYAGAAAIPKTRQINSTARYDWVMLFLSLWITIGFYSDAFAHAHHAVDSFFTPWHATIYTGLAATLLFDGITLVGNHFKGYPWRKAIPKGYTISFIGAAWFAIGGLGDFVWHSLFGIEFNLDAVLSPTHLSLMGASILVFIGSVCALWSRIKTRRLSWSKGFPVVLSIVYIFVMLSLVTSFLHPFQAVSAADNTRMIDESAIASFIVSTAIFIGVTLSILRRWALPFGATSVLVLAFFVPVIFLSGDTPINIQIALVVVGLISALAADLVLWWLKPGPSNVRAYRWFALLVPIIVYSFYFLAIQLTAGIAWTIHSWSGLIVVSGAVGIVISFLIFPPRLPEVGE